MTNVRLGKRKNQVCITSPNPNKVGSHGRVFGSPCNLQANFSEIIFHPKDTGDDPVHPNSNPAPTIEWSPSKGELIRNINVSHYLKWKENNSALFLNMKVYKYRVFTMG